MTPLVSPKAQQRWVVVPEEPTREMIGAGVIRCHGVDLHDGTMKAVCGMFLGECPSSVYERMLAARGPEAEKMVAVPRELCHRLIMNLDGRNPSAKSVTGGLLRELRSLLKEKERPK